MWLQLVMNDFKQWRGLLNAHDAIDGTHHFIFKPSIHF
jgi:hypothetical protein